MTFQCTAYLTHTHSNACSQSIATKSYTRPYRLSLRFASQKPLVGIYMCTCKTNCHPDCYSIDGIFASFLSTAAVCVCVDSLTTVSMLALHKNASHVTLTLQDANMLRYHGNTQVVSIMKMVRSYVETLYVRFTFGM